MIRTDDTIPIGPTLKEEKHLRKQGWYPEPLPNHPGAVDDWCHPKLTLNRRLYFRKALHLQTREDCWAKNRPFYFAKRATVYGTPVFRLTKGQKFAEATYLGVYENDRMANRTIANTNLRGRPLRAFDKTEYHYIFVLDHGQYGNTYIDVPTLPDLYLTCIKVLKDLKDTNEIWFDTEEPVAPDLPRDAKISNPFIKKAVEDAWSHFDHESKRAREDRYRKNLYRLAMRRNGPVALELMEILKKSIRWEIKTLETV